MQLQRFLEDPSLRRALRKGLGSASCGQEPLLYVELPCAAATILEGILVDEFAVSLWQG